ncbi:GtrA family protein [Populibacterium corticicola]|uniref:GtrA family protein n=1 Tax=Populibacterium corticicola TaxID=1812826 RepID=A0ABW5XF66_9MICO
MTTSQSSSTQELAPQRLSISARLAARFVELLKFGIVGGTGFIVDIGLFNLLQHGPFAVLAGKPVTAKILSVAVAMIVTWIGNRLWTFADQRTRTKVREFVGFVVVNIGGMAIAVLCLWISRYVLGFDSPLADNISANVIGLVLGMIFRYLAYKYLVFTGDKPPLDPRSTHL